MFFLETQLLNLLWVTVSLCSPEDRGPFELLLGILQLGESVLKAVALPKAHVFFYFTLFLTYLQKTAKGDVY